MAELPKRIAALTLAGVFLITTIGFSVLIIVQINQQNKNNSGQQDSINKQLKGTKLENFTPVSKVDKLKITDLEKGKGVAAKAGDNVTVYYIGALANSGVVFDSSSDHGSEQPVSTVNLSEVIKGWSRGIPGMKPGGTRRLLIPADLAYGANPPAGAGIPADTDLVFDITLLAAQK